MKKPKQNDRMIVNNKVKFVSKIEQVNPGMYKYFMTNSLGDEEGFWHTIFELREEKFLDYLFNRPGFFGVQTNTKASVEVAVRLLPILAFMINGLLGLIGLIISVGMIWRWIKRHYAWYEECCKNKEEADPVSTPS